MLDFLNDIIYVSGIFFWILVACAILCVIILLRAERKEEDGS